MKICAGVFGGIAKWYPNEVAYGEALVPSAAPGTTSNLRPPSGVTSFYSQSTDEDTGESNRQSGSFILTEYIIYTKNIAFESSFNRKVTS